jgi:hypothetical protein
VITPCHDEDLGDARLFETRDGVIDHGIVAHGQEVLVGDGGQRVEARAVPPARTTPLMLSATLSELAALHRTPFSPTPLDHRRPRHPL